MKIDIRFKEWLLANKFSEKFSTNIVDYTDFIVLSFIALTIFFIIRFFVLKIIHKIISKTSTKWDDAIMEHSVISKLSYVIVGIIITIIASLTITDSPKALKIITTLSNMFIVTIILITINSFISSIFTIYQRLEVSKYKYIRGYLQVLKIIAIVLWFIVIISILLHKSPGQLFIGLGAFSAVLLLVFKDPILGLVAGVQLSANDLVRPNDWIVVPKANADGNVIDITLTTVKIQNWDKTITNIPAYMLVSESFINYRGMEESGGRRIKRSIFIDMSSIKFCTIEMIERFKQIELLKDYIVNVEKDVKEYNKQQENPSIMANIRRQTNIGVFRAYLLEYLRNNPLVNQDMTLLVRQLQPTEIGLPLEVYTFCKIQKWFSYEQIQSDIFDHIFAIIPEFELKLFQHPSGQDIRCLLKNNSSFLVS